MKPMAAPSFGPNLLLFSSFLLVVSLAVFLPLGLFKYPDSPRVLGSFDSVSAPSNSSFLRILSGQVFPGQASYYRRSLRLENPSDAPERYSVTISQVYPLGLAASFDLTDAHGNQGFFYVLPGQVLNLDLKATGAPSPSADGSGQTFRLRVIVTRL